MAKKTTRELVGDFIDLECQLEHANEEESLVLTSALEVTKKDISRKMDGIDYFMVDIDRKILKTRQYRCLKTVTVTCLT